MKRRLIVALTALLALLPMSAAILTTAATVSDPTLPGVPPTAVATTGTINLSSGVAPTPLSLPLGATPDLRPGIAPTAIGTPIALPTLPPTVALPTPAGTPTGTATGTAVPTGTIMASSATPTGTATGTGTATPTACAVPGGTATATGTPGCATVAATATATAPAATTPACPATLISGDTAHLAPVGAKAEVAKMRSRMSRVYDMGNGTYQQVLTTGPINYADASGAFQPIDNTLVAATTPGYAARNKAGDYSLALPTDLSANPVKVTKGNAWVSFSLVGARGTGISCGTTQTYANALPGVALAYAAGSDATEETLTLASSAAAHAFTFTLQTSAGLTARANGHGGIDFVDSSGTVQLGFAPPFMSDSATPKAARSSAVTLTLGQSGGTTVVTLTADAAWLADPARVYPVVIDPTVTFTGARQDCFIASDQPDYAECQSGNGYGAFTVSDDGSTVDHGLVQFDLSQLPINTQIKDAQLQLYGESITGSAPVNLQQVTSGWYAPLVTWNNTGNGGAPWQSPGGDDNGNAFDTITVGPYFSVVYTWHPTQLVRGWLNGSIANDGMLLAIAGGNRGSFTFTGTSGYRDPNNWPKLLVTYPTLDSEIGARGFYTLAGSQLDDRMAAAVNPVSGNLFVQAHDLHIAGTGLDLNVDRYYNSLMDATGEFGNRWAMNNGRDVFLRVFANGNVGYQANSGYQVVFTKNGDGSFATPAGMYADLTFDGSHKYTLTYHATRVQYVFDNTYTGNPVLIWQADQNGNTINYVYYNGQVSAIYDTQGRGVSFHYNGQGFVDTLTDTSISPARVWQYGYSGNNLTSVIDPVNGAGHPTIYAYDGANNLTQITDPKGNVTTLHYPTPNTYSVVDSFTRVNPGAADSTTHFAYNGGNTVITDANGHQTTVNFDQATDLVSSVTDALGHTQSFTYTSKYRIKSVTDATAPTGNVTTGLHPRDQTTS